jgi:hypothetical protein
LEHEAGQEEEVGVRKDDLELEGLHQVEDGRPGVDLMYQLCPEISNKNLIRVKFKCINMLLILLKTK